MNDLKPFLERILDLEKPWYIREITLDQESWKIDIYLDFKKGGTFPCPLCEGENKQRCKAYDTVEKTWRHLNLFQYKAYLHARVPRIACPEHGTHLVHVPWAREGSGFTLLFEAFAMSLIKLMPVAAASQILHEWDTRLWRIAHAYVDKAVEEQSLSSLTAVGVDETSRRKGHSYITAFVDLHEKGAVFVTPGKDAATLEAFKDFLETHGGHAENVRDISMDMSPAFIKGAEEHFPEAAITFDKFHVMKLMNKALDEVRRQEQKENSTLKKTRYLWLKNIENLREDQKAILRELGGASSNLKVARAWRIKLALQDVFTYDSHWAPYFLDKWYWWASHSRLESIVSLAKTIKEHRQGILNYSKSRISNGILEGLNSLFKAAAAKARGYRTLRHAITAYYLVASRLELGLPPLCGVTHTK